MSMPIEECFAVMAAKWADELVITSAGNSSEVWWETTGDTEKTLLSRSLDESVDHVRGRHRHGLSGHAGVGVSR